jgi:CO/xanthine dehydrogenase Mo-binding subunit
VTEALLGDEREPFGERGVYEVAPLGVKGLGELKNVGVYAAVANPVFHATGLRVRDLPILLEKLLSA